MHKVNILRFIRYYTKLYVIKQHFGVLRLRGISLTVYTYEILMPKYNK